MIFAVSLLIYFSLNRIESEYFDRCRVSSNHESQLLAIQHLESSSVKYHNNNNSSTYHSYCNDQSKTIITRKLSVKHFALLHVVQAPSTGSTNANWTTTGIVVTSSTTVATTSVTTTTTYTTITTTCMLRFLMFLSSILHIVDFFYSFKNLSSYSFIEQLFIIKDFLFNKNDRLRLASIIFWLG